MEFSNRGMWHETCRRAEKGSQWWNEEVGIGGGRKEKSV